MGCRTSDQYLTEHSDFSKSLKYEDVVMADRGFNISETLGTYGAQLAIPAFTRGQKQLRSQEAETTRRIANVRIHVERVISNLKQKYPLLERSLPIDFVVTKIENKT